MPQETDPQWQALHDRRERYLAWRNAEFVRQETMFRSVIDLGGIAMRAALLVNGGAAVAMLAFVGSIWVRETSIATGLIEALGWFVWGVIVAGAAPALAYLCQVSYFWELDRVISIYDERAVRNSYPPEWMAESDEDDALVDKVPNGWRYYVGVALQVAAIAAVGASFVFLFLGVEVAGALFRG